MTTKIRSIVGNVKGVPIRLEGLDDRVVVCAGPNRKGKSARVFSLATALADPPAKRDGRGGIHPWIGTEPADDPGLNVGIEAVGDRGELVRLARVLAAKESLRVDVDGKLAKGKEKAKLALAMHFGDAVGLPVDLAEFDRLTPERQRAALEATVGASPDLRVEPFLFPLLFPVVTPATETEPAVFGDEVLVRVAWKTDAGEDREEVLDAELLAELLRTVRDTPAASFVQIARATYADRFSAWNKLADDARGTRDRLPELGEVPPAGRLLELERELDDVRRRRDEVVSRRGASSSAASATAERAAFAAELERRDLDLFARRGRLAARRAELDEEIVRRDGALFSHDATPVADIATFDARLRDAEERYTRAGDAVVAAATALATAERDRERLERDLGHIREHGACPTCRTTGAAFPAAIETAVEVLSAERATVVGSVFSLETDAESAAELRAAAAAARDAIAAERLAALRANDARLAARRELDAARLDAVGSRDRTVEELERVDAELEDVRRQRERVAAAPPVSGVGPSLAAPRADDAGLLDAAIVDLDAQIVSLEAERKRIVERDALAASLEKNALDLSRALRMRAAVKRIREIVEEVGERILAETLGPLAVDATRVVSAVWPDERFAFRPAGCGESGWGIGLASESRGWRSWRGLSTSERAICGLALELVRAEREKRPFRPVVLEHAETIDEEPLGRLLAFLAEELDAGRVSVVLVEWRGDAERFGREVAPFFERSSGRIRVYDAALDSPGAPVFRDYH